MDFTRIHRSARVEGFAIDHLVIPPLVLCRLPPLPPIVDIREPFQFSSDEGLQQLPEFPPPPPEKLVISKDTAALLSSVQAFQVIDQQEDYEFRIAGKRRLEEVLVRADFGRDLLHENKNLRKDAFAAFEVDELGDGGLGWSENVRKSTAAMQRKMEMEKLDIEPHVLRSLKDVSVPPVVGEDDFYTPTEHTPAQLELITPPLLPVQDWETEPLPPIVMADIIKGLSPVDVGTSADLIRELEGPFMAEDANLEPGSPTSFIVTGTSDCESPVGKRCGLGDQKIEVPLTPPPTVVKRVRLSSILATDDVVLSLKREDPPPTDFFEDIARPEMAKLEQALEQEQLQEADSTMRIPVPVMDFSIAKPSWESSESLTELKKWAMIPANRWRGAKSLDINLRWVPFPSEYGNIPNEVVEGGEESIQALLVSEKDCKAAEQAILDSLGHLTIDDQELLEEEELEPGLFDTKLDESLRSMIELVQQQKRKREANSTTQQTRREVGRDPLAKRHAAEEDVPGGIRFSAANSLSSFMTLRAKKPQTITTTNKQTKRKRTLLGLAPSRIHQQAATTPIPDIPHVPLPPLPDTTAPTSFIVSMHLFSERGIFRELKELYPSAIFVERDYSTPIPSGEHVFFPPSIAPMVDDADLIVSPLTGMIYTTLQQLRQRPLPGQTLPPEKDIKSRIVKLTTRYERLLIFIGTPGPLKTTSDTAVVSAFLGFCASLQSASTVIPRVVQSGDAARWILAAMAHERTEYKLIEDETLWESFLRKAGLNAFAAQVVLREVRGPGLAGLLKMGEEGIKCVVERTAGKKVASRVAKVLSTTWGVQGRNIGTRERYMYTL